MKAKFLLNILGLLFMGFLLFHFGRGLWYPGYVQLVGGETVDAVLQDLEEGCLNRLGLKLDDFVSINHITLIALKEERVLEVWIHMEREKRLLKQYPFTAFSGKLGPKLREGDGQIPEGIYEVEYLNPNSSYHLSMKLNYPNTFDQEKGAQDGRENLGYDIFIHGGRMTIGCIPIGDPAIEELFLLIAKIGVEHVTVLLSPFDMRVNERIVEIEEVSWEGELYSSIKTELDLF